MRAPAPADCGEAVADRARAARRRVRVRTSPSGLPARAAGLGLGVALDRVVGDPRRWHPVAGFGGVAMAVEHRLLDPRRSETGQRAAGVLFTGILVGGSAAATHAVGRLLSQSTAGTVAWNAAVAWACLGGSSLLSVARRQDALLRSGDHDGSRALLPWLCGRDPDALDPDDLARAVVESVAENTSDAAVCTLFWAAIAGPAGAAMHRTANTLDAMVGHRSPRYQHFGTASARLDDVLGFVPARLAGLIGVAVAGTIGGSPSGALRTWRRDARTHPSPNAGVVESVCAGALGVRLGGPTPYPYGVQQRAVLGDGRPVRAEDIGRAVRLHDRVQLVTAGLMIAGLLVAHARTVRRDG
ncbi:adenosylcobinamide-phosphate synthase CbiB [Dietzia sp. NPDC055340]